MTAAYPNPSQILPLYFKLNRRARIRFTITQDNTTPNTTGWTWQLFIKQFSGARNNLVNLTLGNGLSYEVYSDTVLVADFTAAQLNLEEGKYYYELVRTDIETTWIEGDAFMQFAKTSTDTIESSNVSVNVDSNGTPVTIALTSAAIFNITGSGGGAWGSITGTLSSQTDLQSALDAKQSISTSETTITDAATMDIAAYKNVLATSSATRTFTISWTGDFFLLTVTLSATSSVFTWPSNALCTNSDSIESGDNTMTLSGSSGDVYEICGKKRGSTYSIVCKNFGQ